LYIGITNASFSSVGTVPDKKERLHICVIGVTINVLTAFITLAVIPSQPADEFLRFDMILETSLSRAGLRKRE
jgi:hypothetical protein